VRIIIALAPATVVVTVVALTFYAYGKTFWSTRGTGVTRGNLVVMGLSVLILATFGLASEGLLKRPPEMVEAVERSKSLKQELAALEKATDEVTTLTELEEIRGRLVLLRRSSEEVDRLYDVGRRKAEVVLTYGFLMQSAIIGVGLALIAGIAIGYARPRADPLRRPFLYVLVIWAAVTAYGAVFEAVAIKSGVVVGGSGLVNAPADIIWLDNDRRLVGAVVRSLDRGTIVRDASSGNLLFVPKDKINRTDLQSQP
jgi:hypothetical protein